jgi:DNA-binding CsgD family transcriptional regulator
MNWAAELSDLAYEAAIVPERWQSFLDRASEVASARGGTLFEVDGMSQHSILSERLHGAWHAIVTEGWAAKNPLPGRALLTREPGFVHDLEVLPAADRAGYEWFEFAAKWDLGPSMGTILRVPNGNLLIMTFERSLAAPAYERADAERFNMLRPSIARAVSLSAQLAFQHFNSTVSVLNAVGLPGAVVNESGKLLTCNQTFEGLIPSLFMDRRDGLRLRAAGADALLQQTLARLKPELWGGTVASVPVPRSSDGDPPAIIHVLPIRGVAQDILFGATGLVLVDRLTERAAPSDTILRALYDLTPAEARVAATLVQNRGRHKQVADILSVSPETVKSHSKAIYQKTGLSGVIELAGVLGGLLPAESDRED